MLLKTRFQWPLAVLAAVALSWTCGLARADIHFAEAFLTGGNPAAGQYALGNLVGQGPAVSTASGVWADGLTTTTPGTFNVVGSGLSWPSLTGTGGGAVQFVSNGAMTNVQSAVRTFDNLNMVAAGTYYMSGMMSFDENFYIDSTSSAFTGLLNFEEGDPVAPYVVGLQWGFQGDASGGVDAVVRMRDNITGNPLVTFVLQTNVQPGNHLFVMRVASDQLVPASGDYNDVWFNPDIRLNQFLAGPPQLPNERASNWLSPEEPHRIVDTFVLRATNLGPGAVVNYDQIRFGDTWEEVTNGKAPFTGISAERAILVEKAFNTYTHQATFFREGSPDEIRGTQTVLQVGSLLADFPATTNVMRTVLSYSLDDIPEGTIVTGAKLKLHMLRLDETGGAFTELNPHLADLPDDFNENASSWNLLGADEFGIGIPWGANGPGNPTSTLLDSIDWADFPSPGGKVIFESAAFLAAIQAAIDGNTPLDLVLTSPVETSGQRIFMEFASDDNANSFFRPVLELMFATTSTAIPGDTNNDGKVDDLDAKAMAAAWGKSSGALWSEGDFNGDGKVDARDAAILAANWGDHTGGEGNASAVPEPSVLALLGIALAAFSLLRRRVV